MASPNTATPTEPVTDTAVIMDGVILNISLCAMLLTVVQTEKPKISFNESLSKYFQFIFISVPRLIIMSLKRIIMSPAMAFTVTSAYTPQPK